MPSTKRKEAAAVTKAKVLDVAREQFATFGFERTNLRQVALLSGYSTGAIFASYRSKEQLFEACFGSPPPPVSVPAFLEKVVDAARLASIDPARSLALEVLGAEARRLRVHLLGTSE